MRTTIDMELALFKMMEQMHVPVAKIKTGDVCNGTLPSASHLPGERGDTGVSAFRVLHPFVSGGKGCVWGE